MIDLIGDNLYFLGAALLIGIATARWAFPKPAAVRTAPVTDPNNEDEQPQ